MVITHYMNPLVIVGLILASGNTGAQVLPQTREAAASLVVCAVVARAETLHRDAKPPTGDLLTNEYIRAAARAAESVEEPVRAAAFALAIGIALDDSDSLRKNLLVGKTVRSVESPDERKQRLKVLGKPTIHTRRDLCQHFAVSASLEELIGSNAAISVGLAKELADSQGPSGFSFADLAADTAGIEFAKSVRGNPKQLGTIAKEFRVEEFVPSVEGLPEGISAKRLTQDYGKTDDPRFAAKLDEIRRRIEALPAYRK